MLAFRIVHHLGAFLRFHKESVTSYLPLLEQIRDGLFPENSVPRHSSNLYSKSLKKLEKLMAPMLSLILKIGQAQLLRRQMNFVLKVKPLEDGGDERVGKQTDQLRLRDDRNTHTHTPTPTHF